MLNRVRPCSENQYYLNFFSIFKNDPNVNICSYYAFEELRMYRCVFLNNFHMMLIVKIIMTSL